MYNGVYLFTSLYIILIKIFIFAGCLIEMLFSVRYNKNKEKDCQLKKLATKRTMNEKNRNNSHCITPYTERNASGRNWELFKNIAVNSSPSEIDTFSKENVQKKSISCCRNSQKKSTSTPKLDATLQLIGETKINNNKKKVTKKLATKRTMDEKNKNNSQCITPHMERNASGRNWELFKNIAVNSTQPEKDTTGKENVEKKSISCCRKSKKKSMTTQKVDTTLQLIGETKISDDKKKVTKLIAMDCEMVGIGDGTESMLARVSIVNSHNYCIYDRYVKPREPVQDYRTNVSGIRPHNLKNGQVFQIVQKEVAEILKGRILIGHALKYDLDVLYLSHPRRHLRDTSRFKLFIQLSGGRTPSLKKLASELLGREIQTGEHSSVEDARAAMQLYLLYKNKWESEFYSRR